MNSRIIIVWFVILVLDCVVAQRVCESKCDEYENALPLTDPRSEHPYLMEIFRIRYGNIIRYSLGILISEEYLVTVHYIATITNTHDLRVRKATVIGEQYTDNKQFSIKRVVYPPDTNEEIALIQLNERISYRATSSIFRPACLWTATIIPSSTTYSFYGWNSIEATPLIRIFFIPPESNSEDVTYFEGNHILLRNASTTISPDIFKVSGSSMLVKYRNRHYVVGIVYDSSISGVATILLGSYISWIESIIWPDYAGCGQRKVIQKPLITHGFPTYHGEYPWHVALYQVQGGRRNSHRYICGGTIINKRTILTAAHCVKHDYGVLPSNQLSIVAGIHVLSRYTIDTQTLLVRNITVHPEYNREYLENDIALINLSGPIEFSNYIQPICFGNTSEYINMTLGTVVGWGNDERNEQSDVLLRATIPLQTYNECRLSNRQFFHAFLNDNNFCAGYDNGTNVCSGDSGGGLVFEHKSRWYIRGIVSVGVALASTGECDVTAYVLFTDVAKFYEWIVRNLEEIN